MSLPEWWKSDKPYIIGDCLEVMRGLPDGCIDLILTDPPYYRIMLRDYAGNKHEWDNQWKNQKDYLEWCRSWLQECHRLLKHNGSIYVFADDKNVSRIHILMEDIGFNLENHIVWHKPNNMPIKGWATFNMYAPVTERILFCSKEHRTHNLENKFYAKTIMAFAPIIEYMKGEKEKVKKMKGFKTDNEFNEYVNGVTDTKSVVSRHYFTYSQWVFPTKELYKKLQSINEVFQKEYEVFQKEYEVLKKEYEVLKKEYETLLRVFNPKKNYTDVWEFNITSSQEKGVHPTQKPITIFNRIIDTSCRVGGVVFDPFLGSGTTLRACREMGMIGLGCDVNQDYKEIITERSMEKVKDIMSYTEEVLL